MNNLKTMKTASCLVAAGLMLSSCELLGPTQSVRLSLPPVPKEQDDGQQAVVYEQLQNKPPMTDSMQSKIELYPGTNRLVNESQAGRSRSKSSGAGSYSLNFDDADLGEVAKVILGDILGHNYILSPFVAGKVTLQTTEALTKDELLPTLEKVLRMNNAALVKEGRLYRIVPAADAVYSADVTTGKGDGQSGFQTRVIPVRYVSAFELSEVIKPLLQEKTIVNVDEARNALVVSGGTDEISRVMDLVGTFDIDVLKGRSFGLFPLAHVSPEDIIKELEAIFISKVGKDGDKDYFRFISIERLNAVLAITHQSRYLADIENWVLRLDRATSANGGGVNVYRVQHMDAVELADTLNSIFTGAQKQSKAAKVAPGETAATITNKQTTTKSTSKKSSAGGSQSTGDASVSNVGEVRIIADQANNSIVTVATPQEYAVILPVIQQLDVMPLQVLIDATIVSVALQNDLRYGIQWFLTNGNDAISSSASKDLASVIRGAAESAALATATGGLSAIYSSGSVKAILNAEAQLGNVKVISSPSLMVLNNQQAKINVGDQVPLQTSTTSVPIAGGDTGASIAQSASIQYQDTGVTLEVTPRVNANGMVIMEIKQIVSNVVPQSTAGPTTVGVTSTATIAKKEIASSVAVQDGETIVLGGLIDNNNSETKSGIPFLHELPWIGPLFGSTTRNDDKNELVVLITPRVVKSKQDSRIISDEFKRKLTGIYEIVPEYSESSSRTIQ